MRRSSGVLLPVSALPSPHGIGTLGEEAYRFIDFLAAAGQRYWQILPLGPTSIGDSPYQPFSSHAGNPYFIDLDALVRAGLLTGEEASAPDWGSGPARVDYGKIYAARLPVLRRAFDRAGAALRAETAAFAEENAAWLPDYALFMALKRRFGMRAWTEWEDAEIRLRRPGAVAAWAERLRDEVEFFGFIQYLFYRQWGALQAYAHEKGVLLIGDLPIYVAMDSADVWAGPQNFLLDEANAPLAVAGVPPDSFSADGQLWGNPLYRWEDMRADGYQWWMARIAGAARLYDVLRIDHFRGLESYWSVPFGETTASHGHWVKGPGMDFIAAVRARFPELPIIAEDLGYLSPEVRALLASSGFPGMKVLEFAFDSREPGEYRPHTYPVNCVCYTGTHDNMPLVGWRENAAPEDVARAEAYFGLNEREGFHWGMIRGGMSSAAVLFIAQMQDYLGLGMESRMNTPSTLGCNWQWRMQTGDCTPALAEKMRFYTELFGRLPE
jgi:4-alpha-glucanotransferase